MRNTPVVKSKRDLVISIEEHAKRVVAENNVYISYKVCVKVCIINVFVLLESFNHFDAN